MSVAFTREESAETAAEVELPDRQISAHPNLVTERGLELLQTALGEARRTYEQVQCIEDVNERRRQSAPVARDLRYFAARLHSAQLVPLKPGNADIAFGSRVTFERDDGRRQSFRIVGEDEAEPSQGTISYASPVARALLGKSIGDVVTVGGHDIEILAIE